MVLTASPFTAADVDADYRAGGRCPLCDARARAVDDFRFGTRADLPTTVVLEHCAACNFLFVGDLSAAAYRRYYASVQNDAGHVVAADGPDVDVALQADRLHDALGASFDGDLLDLGCGAGRLLQRLARCLPRARFHGHDVADWLPAGGPIRFVEVLDDERRYDAIVMTHVLEHLVRFDLVATARRLLKPGGLLYVEVPDPFGYRTNPRREFLYYVDRLHINHFGRRAMNRLLAMHGLVKTVQGTHRFRYRDGHYPAAFTIARSGPPGLASCPEHEMPLDAVHRAYRNDESQRAARVRDAIRKGPGADGVIVYGGGDNCWRARGRGGPLDGVPVLAVVDRSAVELPPGVPVRLATADEAFERFPHAPVAVTASESGDAIAALLRARAPGRRVHVV